jgi:hypothetical protein
MSKVARLDVISFGARRRWTLEEKPRRRAFRSLPIDVALQLGDPQLLLGNQRTVFRRFRTGNRKLRCDIQSLRAFARQRLIRTKFKRR